ncbi:uncharacterized protein LOC132619914 [Lycium barbarum]|uniref:uncharacterized protein LOC132619914 n=1 Tax=Lycium barbarum TaxID=112863 RepID=UPI00293E8E3B|nr:uncharacterized protein LOC132619914 [Lycium barbarum]
MGSPYGVQSEMKELVCELHQLASLGVHLVDSGNTRVSVHNPVVSFLDMEVKERQYKDPKLSHYRDAVPQKERSPFEISANGILRHRSRLDVSNVKGLRRQILEEVHYSRYFIDPGATKMYHDLNSMYWSDEMKKDIAEFVLGMVYVQVEFDEKSDRWCSANVDVQVLSDTAQQISLKLVLLDQNKSLVITLVYAKCNESERMQLWDDLYQVADSINLPWLVGGDFNVVLHEDEKIGAIPIQHQNYEDFAFCVEVEHLRRTGSYHAPLFITLREQSQAYIRPFRFLKFRIVHQGFLSIVRDNWSSNLDGNPFMLFKQKLKHIKKILSAWSKEVYGDIFKQLIIREEIVRIKEELFEEDPSPLNRMVLQQAQAELKNYLHFEEEFWRQKANVTWFSEGDRNTRFSHNLFSQEQKAMDFSLLNHVPSMVSEEDNELLVVIPNVDEVKQAACWHIVGPDVLNVVISFYEGQTLPKLISHKNLVLLPKKQDVQTYADMRPISLSNFINKVISKIVHGRLEGFFPRLVSLNQSGFVKGRRIIENVLLTQEIVTDIRKRGKPTNVIINLDMAKAYDRVSWLFFIRILNKMGFSEGFVDMIWRLIANNWYSVMINGQPHGFFHSTRGVKQGDLLSPLLFILSAEVLSRALNNLFDDPMDRGFGMPKWNANLNHLSYVDDAIIFTSANRYSLALVMEVLLNYETVSGQRMNRDKSCFYIKKKAYYNELIKKVKDKLKNWKGKLMSFGGKVVLNSSLQSMPMYLLSTMVPTKYTIQELHRIFARFYWSNNEDKRNRHWSSWLNMCYPRHEGGMGFRSLFDVSKALFAKLWWRFRTSCTLWSTFMWNKYCKRQIPTLVGWKGGSQLWKKKPGMILNMPFGGSLEMDHLASGLIIGLD